MLKLAVIPGAICGGCDVALASIGEGLLELLKHYEIVYWPTVIDRRMSELESIDVIDVLVYMGGISTKHELESAKKLSAKSRIKVAFGTCSVYGGIPGLNALYSPLEVENSVKRQSTTYFQQDRLGLPEVVKYAAYTDVVEPEILVPGCPPTEKVLNQFVKILVDYAQSGRLQGRHILLGDPESLCRSCPRKPKDASKIVMPGIKRLYEVKLDEAKCFLEQGVLCMGPATRAICNHSCIANNFPCYGCGGPVEMGSDAGLAMLSALSSVLMVDREKSLMEAGLARELDKIADPVGHFFKYTLPKSYLSRIIAMRRGEESAR
jgi:F420-non-reducing hydrogenase small subunit